MAPAENVNVEVVNALRSRRAVVDDEAAAFFGKALLARYFRCDPHKVAEEGLMLGGGFGEAS